VWGKWVNGWAGSKAGSQKKVAQATTGSLAFSIHTFCIPTALSKSLEKKDV
jgi:hypothetical protein